jgi:hypothetical protein
MPCLKTCLAVLILLLIVAWAQPLLAHCLAPAVGLKGADRRQKSLGLEVVLQAPPRLRVGGGRACFDGQRVEEGRQQLPERRLGAVARGDEPCRNKASVERLFQLRGPRRLRVEYALTLAVTSCSTRTLIASACRIDMAPRRMGTLRPSSTT